ncbi:MAG: hypothetical protein ACLTH3_00690 [Lachnospira sp.]
MFKKYQLRSYNFRLVILLIVTSVYGIAVINSADSSYTIKQCAGLLLSLFVMVVVSLIDYNWLLVFLLDYVCPEFCPVGVALGLVEQGA